jgi:hypothetical protein
MYDWCDPDAIARYSYGGGNNGNSVPGPRQGNDRLRGRALKDHTRPDMRDLTGSLEPCVRSKTAAEQ